MTTTVTEAVKVRDLERRYGDRVVISDLDLDVQPGEFLVLLGASGCGKTTLLRTLAGLDPIDGGEVEVPERVAYVFQEPRLLPWRSANANIRLAISGRGRAEAERIASAALKEVGLDGYDKAAPSSLSGGQAQRVALGRALVGEPQLLLLDEPFAALDALTRLSMQELVLALAEKHQPATVLVTHDVHEAVVLADRIAVMREGRIDAIHTIDAPRPRDRESPEFAALRVQLLAELGVH